MRRARHAPALVVILLLSLGLASCDESLQIENAATDPAELARYLPEDASLVQTTDVTEARRELGLPTDADATPTEQSFLRDPDSPQSKLFALTSRSLPLVARSSPLDGTLIRAAAQDSAGLSIVSTAEPFNQVADKLKRSGYVFERGLYVKGQDAAETASPVVADGGSGRVVFAESAGLAQRALRRMEERAEPRTAAEALNAVSGSVKFAITRPRDTPKKSRCIEALAAAQSALGRGAIMAMVISGDKPDPDRFDASKLKALDIGTASVLVDALLVPFNIAKPTGKTSEPITELITYASRRPSPFDAYDCP